MRRRAGGCIRPLARADGRRRTGSVQNGNRSIPSSIPDLANRIGMVGRPSARRVSSVAESQSLYEPSFEHDACGFGFVCDIAGRPSHGIVRDALTVLVNLEHRGASGSERNSGDGAGILTGVPHAFLRAAAREAGLDLPAGGGQGVAMVFLPRDTASRAASVAFFEQVLAAEEGQ